MRRIATLLIGAMLLMSFASIANAQRWKYPPGPPYRSCPDTLTVFDVQNPDTIAAPCHPATLDTVWGVQGVITGFDAKASAYGFYMQSGGAWTGVDVFTGATNYNAPPYNLQLGDLVAVYGTTQEFPASNGETEIEGPDAVQGTNDILIRKISSGNPLPAIHVGTTAEFNWVPGISAATAEPWEGCLVRIEGPLRVARISGSGVAGNTFLIVSVASPADSVLIDGFTLTTFGTPAVGTIVDWVQGILNQRNSTSGTGSVNSYRIQLRDGNDISLATPPNITDAYPIEDNKVRVVFDRNVDPTTAQNAGNYSLASGIDGSTVDAAALETNPGNVVVLTITSVRVDGDLETLTGSNVGSASCPTCLMTSQSRGFAQGVMEIKSVQQADPANLSLFDDRSRFAGPGTGIGANKVSFRGVSTGTFATLAYVEDATGGLRSGLSIFGPSAPLTTGHQYLIVGQVQEFGNETEVVSTVYIKDEGVVAVPTAMYGNIHALEDTTTDVAGNLLTGEDYEGVLVKLEGVHITENRTTGQSFFATGFAAVGSDTILVSNLNGVLDAYDPPDSMTRLDVTGIMHFANASFRICPRNAADIVEYGIVGVGDQTRAIAFRVGPNPGRVANVTFALPTARTVDIGVFDLAGRRLATLARGNFDAGTHTRTWDGTDASGNRANPGVYFYRAKLGNEVRTVRSILLD